MTQGQDRRRTIRLRAGEGSVLLDVAAQDAGVPGFPLVDISEGGLCFLVPSSVKLAAGLPEVGDGFDVTVELPGLEKPLRVHGLVRRSSVAKGFGSTLVGIEFTGLDEWQRATLRGAVIEVARERIEKGYLVLREGIGKAPGSEGGKLLGTILVERDVIRREDLEQLLAAGSGEPLGRTLVRAGAVSEWQLVVALAEQAGLEPIDLRDATPAEKTAMLFTPAFLMGNRMVPLQSEGDARVVAVANLPQAEAVEEVKRILGDEVGFVIASEAQISQILHGLFGTTGRTRSSPRVAAEIPVVFSILKDTCEGDAYEGLTENVSEGGLLFAGPAPKGVGLQELLNSSKSIRLRARLGTADEFAEAVCSPVRLSVMPSPPDHWLYAVRIEEVDPEHLDRLRVFQFYQRFKSDEPDRGGD